MPIRIQSAIYNNLPPTHTPNKFLNLRYTVSGQADVTMGLTVATAWQWRIVVSASASALGGGVSAGGLDSLETSFGLVSTTGSVNQLQIVTERAVTATAWFMGMQIEQQLNPTQYLYRVSFAKVQ